LLVLLAASLFAPVESWRTGRRPQPPLELNSAAAPIEKTQRLWIDTDAACGTGRRTDPDDCLAIAYLARSSELRIVGISTVFGNASREEVDQTVRVLAERLALESAQALPVYSGSDAPLGQADKARTHASAAIEAALEEGPLTFLALGPLTNLATVLTERPDLRPRVARLVAVMGRRPGHIFHPAEGANGGKLFGHGPMFRDFNVAQDVWSASRIVAANLPLTLIPYDAARAVEITVEDLDRLSASPGVSNWIAERSRAWHAYWLEGIGRSGFYPFDLIAAVYAADPSLFRCAQVHVWVGEDDQLPFWSVQSQALLVSQKEIRIDAAMASGTALYCPEFETGRRTALIDRLAGAPSSAAERR
jgi:inosine-uridine nucleoside N-ribohydrolase